MAIIQKELFKDIISDICELMRLFPETLSIEIVQEDILKLTWTDHEYHTEKFESSDDMIDWMIENLEEKEEAENL